VSAGFIALVIAVGCSSSSAPPAVPYNENIVPGTLSLPGVDGYSETFTIASSEPASGVRARVVSSVTAPADVQHSSALCSPSNVTNPLLYITFNVSASVTIVPGSLVVTVPTSVSTNEQTFYALFVDATNLPSGCVSYNGVPNTPSGARTFTFNINDGASTTFIPSDTYELVISSMPFFCCPTSTPSAASESSRDPLATNRLTESPAEQKSYTGRGQGVAKGAELE
jgi:hypothetical protein